GEADAVTSGSDVAGKDRLADGRADVILGRYSNPAELEAQGSAVQKPALDAGAHDPDHPRRASLDGRDLVSKAGSPDKMRRGRHDDVHGGRLNADAAEDIGAESFSRGAQAQRGEDRLRIAAHQSRRAGNGGHE